MREMREMLIRINSSFVYIDQDAFANSYTSLSVELSIFHTSKYYSKKMQRKIPQEAADNSQSQAKCRKTRKITSQYH